MKIYSLLFTLLLCATQIKAQTAAVAVDNSPHTNHERFQIMKGNSQTFQDYKVIKETILDGVWKIALDTIKNLDNRISGINNHLAAVNEKLGQVENELKIKEASIAEITFDSTHLSLLGIQMTKNFSLFLFFSVTGALSFAIVLLLAKMKLMMVDVNESKLIVNNLTNEFDDFRKNALEKQAKLSRQLQTERNKIQDTKGV